MNFQIHALPAAPFASLFDLTDADLAVRHIIRKSVTEFPGYPCRISLEDADVGETVLLLNHTYLPEDTPYQASHAIYVRKDVAQAMPQPGEVPDVLTRRLISVRHFDAQHLMIEADVLDGVDVGAALRRAFDDPSVAYVHLHNAKQGCFAAKATRVADA
ncbi:MAG: DUF1203 domain-containing protein [Paracoccaceae bacterium]